MSEMTVDGALAFARVWTAGPDDSEPLRAMRALADEVERMREFVRDVHSGLAHAVAIIDAEGRG